MSALVAEMWTWYALTWLIVIARMVSRTLLLGSVKKWQWDDYLMLLAMASDTVLMVGMRIISETSSNLIDPNEKHLVMSQEEIDERTFGSKMVLVVEQMQLITIWLMKACLLIMYNKLTMSLKQNLAVKIVAGYVAVGFVVMEILYLGVWCRPFYNYWAVPPPNTQCSAATNHLITNAVLNISSDLMIIMIPMPMLIHSQLPVKRKAILCGVFALGAFTILSAILNKFYSFKEPFGSNWTFWYIRESSTALITTNLPYIWHLLRRMFNLRSFNGSSHKKSNPSTGTRFQSNFSRTHRSVVRAGDHDGLERIDSEERINATYAMPLKIYRRDDVEVTTEAATGKERHSPDFMTHHTNIIEAKEASLRTSRDETESERSAVGVVKAYRGI